MVVAKLPTWIVTGCVTGLIAGTVLLKVKLDPNPKASWLGVPPNWIASRAWKVRKGTPGGGGTMAMPERLVPTGMVATTVLLAVAITETLAEFLFAT